MRSSGEKTELTLATRIAPFTNLVNAKSRRSLTHRLTSGHSFDGAEPLVAQANSVFTSSVPASRIYLKIAKDIP